MQKHIRCVWLLTVLMLCLSFFTACRGDGGGSITERPDAFVLTLNKTATSLLVGEEETLTTNYTGKEKIVWSVADMEVLSVTNGLITGLSAGETSVYASVDGQKAECTVVVKAVDEELIKLVLCEQDIRLDVGAEHTVEYEVAYNGEDVEAATVKFALLNEADEAIAISADGKITAKRAGTSTCIATVAYQGVEKDFAFTVTVNSAARVEIEESQVEIYATESFGGKTYKRTQALSVKVFEGEQAVQAPELTFTVEDPSVCEVVDNAVTGKHSGKTVVTVCYEGIDGIEVTDTVFVTVRAVEYEVALDAVDIDKAQGYVLDKAVLFGDADIEFERIYLADGDFESEVGVEGDMIVLDNVNFSGDSALYFETGVVSYRLNICIWTKTFTSTEEFKTLLNATSGWYKLGGDIELSGVEWKYELDTIVFAGRLDGCGYTVKGLSGQNGLFKNLGNGAVVKNIKLSANIDKTMQAVGAIADETTVGASVSLENIFADVSNNGTATGGLIGKVGAGSTVDLKNVTVHSYTSGESTANGSLFGAFGGQAVFENVKVYANTALSGESSVSGNTGYADLNGSDSVTIKPQKQSKAVNIVTEKISLSESLSGVETAMIYAGTGREATLNGNEIALKQDELLDLAGGTVEVLLTMNDGTLKYYLVDVSSKLEIKQSNAAYLFKVSDCDFVLTENIDLRKAAGTPVPLRGSFDGQGYSVTGITSRARKIEYENGSVSYWYSGVWSSIDGGVIKNTAFIIEQIGWCMGGIAYTATDASFENVYVQVKSLSESGIEDNYQGALFRQVALSAIKLKDVVVEICAYTGTRVGFIGMCYNGPFDMTGMNCHFIGGNGSIIAYSDSLTAGYLKNEALISGANKYADRAAFDKAKEELTFTKEMLAWLGGGSGADKPIITDRQESEEDFNKDWLN